MDKNNIIIDLSVANLKKIVLKKKLESSAFSIYKFNITMKILMNMMKHLSSKSVQIQKCP